VFFAEYPAQIKGMPHQEVSVAQATSLLGFSPKTIRAALADGRLELTYASVAAVQVRGRLGSRKVAQAVSRMASYDPYFPIL